MIFWYEELLMGKVKKLYPEWSCTKKVTEKTRASRKLRKLRGKRVTPQPVYSFHTPFYAKTDGKQWVIQSDSSYGGLRATGFLLSFALIFCLIAGGILYQYHGWNLFSYLAMGLFVVVVYAIYKSRTGGEDTWVVFDRTTGNVCFWKKSQNNSLTVPFDKVNCYWIRGFQRGGPTYSLYFMPTENLPNESHRWWKVYFGFPHQYEQARFFWRVLTDFMDRSRPIPEVPGLIHQVRFVEKNGYTIEDLTEGGIKITEADFNEVEEEINNDMAALEARLRRMIKPDQFNADDLIQFYEHAPVYYREDALRIVMTRLDTWLRFLKGEDRIVASGFRDYFTLEEYGEQLDKLAAYFGPIFKERQEAIKL